MKIVNRWLTPLALTFILIGYLTVWHPSPVAGLRLIGWEVGEWVKFLPAFIQGNAPTNRNWFYIPPITLSIALILWASHGRGRIRTWLTALFALPIAFLAVPDIPIIVDESRDQWLTRVLWFGGVCLLVLIAPLLGRLPGRIRAGLLLVCGLLGAALPTAAYQASRWHIADLTTMTADLGIGLWLNVLGHLLLLIPAYFWFKDG